MLLAIQVSKPHTFLLLSTHTVSWSALSEGGGEDRPSQWHTKKDYIKYTRCNWILGVSQICAWNVAAVKLLHLYKHNRQYLTMRKIQFCRWKFGEVVDRTAITQLKVDQYSAGWTNESSRTEHTTWNLKNMEDECSPVGHDGLCCKILHTHPLLVTVLNYARFQQYKLCTYNVALRRVRETIVVADRQ